MAKKRTKKTQKGIGIEVTTTQAPPPMTWVKVTHHGDRTIYRQNGIQVSGVTGRGVTVRDYQDLQGAAYSAEHARLFFTAGCGETYQLLEGKARISAFLKALLAQVEPTTAA